MCASTHTHTHNAHTNTCIPHTCTHKHTYACIHIHTHTHTHTQSVRQPKGAVILFDTYCHLNQNMPLGYNYITTCNSQYKLHTLHMLMKETAYTYTSYKTSRFTLYKCKIIILWEVNFQYTHSR